MSVIRLAAATWKKCISEHLIANRQSIPSNHPLLSVSTNGTWQEYKPTPRLHILQCTSIMMVQILLTPELKRKETAEKNGPKLEPRTVCSMRQQPNRLFLFSHMLTLSGCHASVRTNRHTDFLTWTQMEHPCRETTLARPTSTRAGSEASSKVKHVQETLRRTVYPGSSYFEDGSKSVLNQSLRRLSCRSTTHWRLSCRSTTYWYIHLSNMSL